MSEASQFREYAEEALRWAVQSTTEKERLSLMELVRTWTRAATASEPPPVEANPGPAGVSDGPTDHNTAR